MKKLCKILLVCIFVTFAFSRASNKYSVPSENTLVITALSHNKAITETDYTENEGSLEWKRRHKRRKKMRRKKRGM
tara:strand:- start:36 stop:263 length:228 start_codon:yes stop_codon:yes gene_type:complete